MVVCVRSSEFWVSLKVRPQTTRLGYDCNGSEFDLHLCTKGSLTSPQQVGAEMAKKQRITTWFNGVSETKHWDNKPMVETEHNNGTGYRGQGLNIISETGMFYIPKHRSTLHTLWTARLRDLETSECQFTITVDNQLSTHFVLTWLLSCDEDRTEHNHLFEDLIHDLAFCAVNLTKQSLNLTKRLLRLVLVCIPNRPEAAVFAQFTHRWHRWHHRSE